MHQWQHTNKILNSETWILYFSNDQTDKFVIIIWNMKYVMAIPHRWKFKFNWVAALVHFLHTSLTIYCSEYFSSVSTYFPRLRCYYFECRQVIFEQFGPDSPCQAPSKADSTDHLPYTAKYERQTNNPINWSSFHH